MFFLLVVVASLLSAVVSKRLSETFIAIQLIGVLTVFVLVLLAFGLNRPRFVDVALTFALLSFPAGFLFAHFFEHWLP